MKLIFTTVLIFFLVSSGFGQTNKKEIDSLIVYLESDAVAIDDFKQIKNVCSKVERLSKQIEYNEGEFISNLILAQVFRDFSGKKVGTYISRLDDIYKKSASSLSKERIIEYLLVKGYVSGSRGNFSKELDYYLQADSMVREFNLSDYEMIIDQHIANFYSVNEEPEKALVVLKKIVKYVEKNLPKDDYSYALSKANLGIGFSELREYDSTIYYTQEAIDDGLGNYVDLHYQYLTISDAYLKLNKLDSAQKYLEITENLYKENYVYSIDVVNFNLIYGHYYAKLKNFDKAIEYYRLALKDANDLNFINGIKIANENLLIASFKRENKTALLSYFKEYKNARDTITGRANLKTEQEHLVQYETLKKDAEISELKLLQEIESERKWFTVSVLIIIVLVLLFLIYRYRSKQTKLKQKVQLENFEKEKAEQQVKALEKELTFSINNLQAHARIIEELKKSSKTESDINEMIETFNKHYIDDSDWKKIILQFDNIHQNYLTELKKSVPNLSNNDIKLAILTKLDYPNSEMAEILNISIHGVKKAKQRLKGKLDENNNQNLTS